MTKPAILITRAIFPEVLEQLSEHFAVESNQADTMWSPDELAQRLQGKVGALTTGSERIGPEQLATAHRRFAEQIEQPLLPRSKPARVTKSYSAVLKPLRTTSRACSIHRVS